MPLYYDENGVYTWNGIDVSDIEDKIHIAIGNTRLYYAVDDKIYNWVNKQLLAENIYGIYKLMNFVCDLVVLTPDSVYYFLRTRFICSTPSETYVYKFVVYKSIYYSI
jgi:hypothetical protein